MAYARTYELEDLIAGLAAHRAGRFVEAELAYRRALETTPESARAAHLQGVLLLSLHRAEEAVLVLRHALALCPEDHDIRRSLAQACARAGEGDQATDLLRGVLAQRPGDLAARLKLATLLRAGGEFDAAETVCRQALADGDGAPELLVALADIQLARGDGAGAAATYRTAMRRHPAMMAAQAGLAMALIAQGQHEIALETALAATRQAPATALAWNAAGIALRRLARPDEAAQALERSLRLEPDSVSAWINLGLAQADRGAFAEAERCLRASLALDPASVEGLCGLGVTLTETGRLPEAIGCFDQALALRPGRPETHWHRAVARLLAGDMEGGWADFEWRKRHPYFSPHYAGEAMRRWEGGDPAGLRILVRAEQGLGDTLQFARYLPMLAQRGAHVLLMCQAPLRRLLSQLPVEIVGDEDAPAADAMADLLSLPALLSAPRAHVAMAAGYLTAPAAGSPAAPAGGVVRIGIAWAGNPRHANDQRRSLPPRAVAAMLAAAEAAPRLRFESLQVGPRAGEAARLYGLADRSAELVDFAATAHRIAQLDLVLAADTAVAHLAGAMGKPVWVLLPYAPDWRWMLDRDTSPWYHSMRLFRQSTPGDWGSVAARVAAALIARYGDGAHRLLASAPASAASPVTTAPQTMSAAVTRTDQPCSVARLVKSYVP